MLPAGDLSFRPGPPILCVSSAVCGCDVRVRFRQGPLAVFSYGPTPGTEAPAKEAGPGRSHPPAPQVWRSFLLFIAPAAGAALAIVQSSFFEWTFHRYWLHRPWRPKECFTSHTLVHHQLCKHDDTFVVTDEEQHEALSFAWWGGPALIAINVAPWALLACGLAALGVSLPSVPFVSALAATVALYYAGYETLHYLMHKPSIPAIERSRYFRFIERHHGIHHVHMDRNLNVLLPLADWALGTLVTEKPVSAPTPESARRLARRHSRFGERLRSSAR